jgi:small-conductance mechanosensitive channel
MRARFWLRQAVSLIAAVTTFIGLISLWFDDPTRLATGLGLVTAGLAFALQKVVTALAGYVVIMRGKTFEVGDRIVMGGVRGDVIGLTFTQTTIMEMGQPPAVQNADPAMWVKSRQFTGRLVTVSNARVFDEPIYNYTREFPYIWEEIAIPISYTADRDHVENLMLESAERHTSDVQKLSKEDLEEMRRRYQVPDPEVRPKVFYRLTDNWLELTVRFLAPDHRIRDLKDRISRDILRGLEERGIQLASATFEITGLPALKLDVMSSQQAEARRDGRENGRRS